MPTNIKENKWVEIDIDAVVNNLQQVKSHLAENVRLIAVIKANAYGHGLVETANILINNGVDYLAVTFLEEALALRQAGITCSILLLAPLVNKDQLVTAFDQYISVSISSLDEAEIVQAVVRGSHTLTVHIKVDTGLGRFGGRQEEILEICSILQTKSNIYIEGIYTHMAEGAARFSNYTNRQFASFMALVDLLEQNNIHIPLKHCANSAVFLKYPHMHLDAVRIGTLLSGQHPAGAFSTTLSLKDPFIFKTRIISVRTLKAGSFLGYQRSYRLFRSAQIAVIPVGFADGLVLEVGNRPGSWWDLFKTIVKLCLNYLNIKRFGPQVIIKGQQYPIRGKVFMQLALIQIPLPVEINIGDEVTVPLRKTLVSPQVVRVYTRAGKIGKIMSAAKVSYMVINQKDEEE